MRKSHLAAMMLVSCSSGGGDDGGAGGAGDPGKGLTCAERASAVVELDGSEPALGLWRDDGRRAQFGDERSNLTGSTVVGKTERQLRIQTVAGEVTFGWPTPLPKELEDAASWTGSIQQRSSWDLFILPEVTLALWLSDTAAAPAGVPALDMPVATLVESCRAEESCGALVLDALVYGDVTIPPGATAEVEGWRITNHGVLRPDGCDAERVSIVSAVR